MNHNYAGNIDLPIIARLVLLVYLLCGTFVMPKNARADEATDNVGSFAFSVVGDHQYGGNGIGVWPSTGKIRLAISNALSSTLDSHFDGVGLLEAQLSTDDLKRAIGIRDQLCQAAEEKASTDLRVDPMINYSIGCIQDGKPVDYQGRLAELPKKLAFTIDDFFKYSLKKYTPDGRPIVKLDATVADVQRERDRFIVSVKFINGGHFPIRMRTPDQWIKLGGDRLEISGFRVGGNGEWRTDLAGAPIVNKGDYSVETIEQPMGDSGTFVTLPEGGSVTFKFKAVPRGKVPKGTYEFDALVFTTINVKGVFGVGGRVNFPSDRTKTARVTFDTDYPSTPAEWKDYEARQREKMSLRPVRPGETVIEPGYYRSVSASGEQGQFVVGLLRGEQTESLERKSDRWLWDADLALSARCKPGEPCPREGRWVARTMASGLRDTDSTHPETERYLLAGQIAPDLGRLGGVVPYHYWHWLGV
ncbi:hypothetical protein [Paraburkholderia sp. J41]|uniref:hypothetical protein n=1 Tax=Paraburkholderia sp. J41 TaxID=2805433 RepID=UPI002AC33173|nr:hypothetical protein [Paraburkholderia sp. J41]